MPLEYAFLKTEQLARISETFTIAFADYYLDMSSMSERIFTNRAVKNSVRYDCSVGVFDESRLVGVTLAGIDDWLGQPAAFDAGTGIIPDYRGRGIARKMFDFAVPKLRDYGVKKFLLEVLQVNEPAIKAYKAAGFGITPASWTVSSSNWMNSSSAQKQAVPSRSNRSIKPRRSHSAITWTGSRRGKTAMRPSKESRMS